MSAAQKAHDDAAAFHSAALQTAGAADTDYKVAVGRRDELLQQVADGSDVSEDALLQAEDDAPRQLARRDVANAKADRAKARKVSTQLDLLRATRDTLEADFDAATDEQIRLAAEVDRAFQELNAWLSDFRKQANAVEVAYQAMRHHNMHTVAPGHIHADVLVNVAPEKQPRCRLPGGANGYLPDLRPETDLYQVQARGTYAMKREPIVSVAGRLRQAYSKPLPSKQWMQAAE